MMIRTKIKITINVPPKIVPVYERIIMRVIHTHYATPDLHYFSFTMYHNNNLILCLQVATTNF